MEISINGDLSQIDDNSHLQSVLESRCFANKAGIAVAVNNVVVPKARWAETVLCNNDKVLIIAATKGG